MYMCTLEAYLGVVAFYFLSINYLKNIIHTPLFGGMTYTYTPGEIWSMKITKKEAKKAKKGLKTWL
jgi:hypothetical protein